MAFIPFQNQKLKTNEEFLTEGFYSKVLRTKRQKGIKRILYIYQKV
jgi:hypothetical protein